MTGGVDGWRRASGLVAAAHKNQDASTILAALCMLTWQAGELEQHPELALFARDTSRSKARSHLENVKTFTERSVLAPLEDLELERRAGLHRQARPLNPNGTKVGRNDPCPCGSGKKYKRCCEGKTRR